MVGISLTAHVNPTHKVSPILQVQIQPSLLETPMKLRSISLYNYVKVFGYKETRKLLCVSQSFPSLSQSATLQVILDRQLEKFFWTFLEVSKTLTRNSNGGVYFR